MDAEAFRADSRERWERAAAGWEERREAMQRATRPVSMWLVEQVRPQPGHRLLELAAGVADTGLLAAELVQPGGVVIVSDQAEAMLDAARRRAEELGVGNVEFRRIDAEWIDLPTASVDGVISRWGYMLLADPEAALRETRRVLRPGGRVALAAFASPGENPWLSAIGRTMAELGFAEPPPPGTPGPFAFAEPPGRIAELLETAGFEEPRVETIDFTWEHQSLDAHFDHQYSTSLRLREDLAKLSPAEHARLRDAVDARLARYVRPDGWVELPARTYVASAVA